MNQQEFDAVVKNTIDTINKLLVVKGGEYAGSEDRLANFKRGATLTGCTPLQTLFIYLSKHYDAVATYVRDKATDAKRERSEPIGGRLDDIINYCILAKALIVEMEEIEREKDLYEGRKSIEDNGKKYLTRGFKVGDTIDTPIGGVLVEYNKNLGPWLPFTANEAKDLPDWYKKCFNFSYDSYKKVYYAAEKNWD